MRSSKQEHKKELKNTVAEPKNSIDGFDSKLDQAEERISETWRQILWNHPSVQQEKKEWKGMKKTYGIFMMLLEETIYTFLESQEGERGR